MEEIWKEVVGYDGLYEVSNQGRVRSVDRSIAIKGGNVRLCKGKILRPSENRYGYLCVILCKEGKGTNKKIHRLVAEAFIPNPNNKPCIDHINTIRTDNRIENLRWCTQKENCNNPISIVRYNNTDKYKPVAQYSLDGELIAVYPSLIEAERQTGCKCCNIIFCCNGGYYRQGKWYTKEQDKGYKWKYHNEEGES